MSLRRVIAPVAIVLFSVCSAVAADQVAPRSSWKLTVETPLCLGRDGDDSIVARVSRASAAGIPDLAATLIVAAKSGGPFEADMNGGPVKNSSLNQATLDLEPYAGWQQSVLAEARLVDFVDRQFTVNLRTEQREPLQEVMLLLRVGSGTFLYASVRTCGAGELLQGEEQSPVPQTGVDSSAPVTANGLTTVFCTFKYTDDDGVTRPIRYAKVELWDYDVFSTNDYLATAITDGSGSATFSNVSNSDPEAGTQDIYFVVWTESAGVVRVTSDGSTTYQLASGHVDNIPDGTNYYTMTYTNVVSAGALNLYDIVSKTHDYVVSQIGVNPSQIRVDWPSNDGTKFIGSAILIGAGNEFYESPAAHEYGHFLDYSYAGGFHPVYGDDGGHDLPTHETPATAWGEGWADFFQSPVRSYWGYSNSSYYVDAGHFTSLETGASWPGLAQQDVELAIAAILWDVYDSSSDTGDSLSKGINPIWTIFDSGVGDETIYDFWTGWVNRSYGSLGALADNFYEHGCWAAVTDTTPPVVTITSPTSGSTWTTTAASLTVGGTMTDNVGIGSWQWYTDRGYGASMAATTNFSVNVPLVTGQNVITINAYDRKGNPATDTLTVTSGQDYAPSIVITYPTSSSSYTASSSSLSLAGSTSDDKGVSSVTWTSDRGGSGTATGTTTWSVGGITLYSGYNNVTVTARDTIGQTASDSVSVYYAPPQCTIMLTSPNGGQSFTRGQNMSITWSSSAACGSTVRLELLRSGSVVTTINGSTSNDGSYGWTVPSDAAIASDYQVRVTDTATASSDASDSTFSVQAAPQCSIQVTSPDNGSVWTKTQQYPIQWTSSNCASTVRIDLWRGNTQFVRTIASNVANNGLYYWTVPSDLPDGTDYNIDVNDPAAGIGGFKTFTITGGSCNMTITSPAAGVTWSGGATQTVSWARSGSCGATVSLDLLKNGVAMRRIVTATPNGGTYTFPLSTNFWPGPDYTVKLSDSAGTVAESNRFTLAISMVSLSTIAGDVDADGDADLFWRHRTRGDNSEWLMNGTVIQKGLTLASVLPEWKIVGLGDFQGDRKTDLLWRNSNTGRLSIWMLSADQIVQSADLGVIPLSQAVAGVGDFNGDGKSDILWRTTAGENSLWLMNGAMAVSKSPVQYANTSWTVAAVADLSGDLRADIVWRNASTGGTSVWLMSGAGPTSAVTLPDVKAPWVLVGAGDMQGDGKSDLVWFNPATGRPSVWLLDGTAPPVAFSVRAVAANWSIARIGDFNRDGRADWLWRSTATGANSVWLMDGPAPIGSSTLQSVPDTSWEVVK